MTKLYEMVIPVSIKVEAGNVVEARKAATTLANTFIGDLRKSLPTGASVVSPGIAPVSLI